MSKVIGIDLGTSFSVVATIDEMGRPVIVPNNEDATLTPSVLAYRGENHLEVGEFARKTWGSAPDEAAARFKRDMGTSKAYRIREHDFTPTELSTFVLKKLVQDTQARIGPISEAVVTIPANFAHEARQATMAAAKAAGLSVKFIINEPTAAALYYAYKREQELSGIYAVYDLGGGTFDVSIIRVDGQNIEVLATNGVAKLGGDDFDRALQNLVARKFAVGSGRDFDPDDFPINDAEDSKKSLSARKRVTARVGRELIDVTREEFEDEISSLISQTELLCEAAIDEAGVAISDIREVFLAGGSTRVPAVLTSVQRVFGRTPIVAENVDEVVALGAALYAASKVDQARLTPTQRRSVSRIQVSESTAMYFGTLSVAHDATRDRQVLSNSIIIRKGDKIPCAVTQSYYTIHDNQTAVNCQVTESASYETDPRFVKIIWSGKLELPPNRPKEQEIKITFSYDANQIMKCSFVDVATGRTTNIDLHMASAGHLNSAEIDKFLVE